MPMISIHFARGKHGRGVQNRGPRRRLRSVQAYDALILAATYAVRHQLPAEVTHLQSKLKFLAILAIATAVLGSFFLLRIQSHMARSRRRLDKLQKTYFTPNELKDISLTDEEVDGLGDENDLQDKPWWRPSANWLRGLEFTGPLIFVLWVGAALVCLHLWSVKP